MHFKHAYTVKEACETLSIGKTKLYGLISAGFLQARHLGCRTVITGTSLREFLTDLPVAGLGTTTKSAK